MYLRKTCIKIQVLLQKEFHPIALCMGEDKTEPYWVNFSRQTLLLFPLTVIEVKAKWAKTKHDVADLFGVENRKKIIFYLSLFFSMTKVF